MASRILFYVLLLTVAPRAISNYEIEEEKVNLIFSEEPNDVIVVRGSSARLDCAVKSNWNIGENFTVIWFQDGQPIIIPDPRRVVLPNGSLYFEKVLHKRSGRSSSDEGMYNCVVRNSFGAFVSKNASVRVAALGREYSVSPTDVSAEVNDVVRLWCQIESVPKAQISWEKDGQPINGIVTENNYVEGSRIVSFESGALHIYNVQFDDAGGYRCVARNDLANKERRSSAGRLLVIPRSEKLRALQFLTPLRSPSFVMWVSQGSNTTLECLSTGNPLPTIKWVFNGTNDLVPSAKIFIRPGFLFLSNVDSSMTGYYGCVAVNDANSTASQVTSLQVTSLPFFITTPKSQVFPTAKTVRFECEVGGNPLPEVSWLKDGTLLPISGRIKQRVRNGGSLSELVLSNTVTTDSGFYQCIAQNVAGAITSAARLLVNASEGRPEPPTNLQAVALSYTEILLTWDAPRNIPQEDIKAYTVHYMPIEGGEELQEVAVNTTHKIENLKRDTNYSFYVRAYIRKSASDQSEKVFCRTGDTIPATVSNITLTALSPTTLKVSWPKPPNDPAQPVPLYKIQYRRHRAREFDIEVVKGDANEYIITGLHPGKKYDVRVVSGNVNVLPGHWYSKEMPKVSSESNLLTAPNMQLFSFNSTSVTVTWEIPGNGRKKPEMYKLFYRKQGTRIKGPITIPATVEGTYIVGNLIPNAVYEVQLSSHAENEDSPASNKLIRTLINASAETENSAAFDEHPILLDPEVLSSSSVKLAWQLSTDVSSVAYYTIRYSLVSNMPPTLQEGAVSTRRDEYVRTTGNEVELTNLKPFTPYQFSVRYHDNEGRYSVFSPPVHAQTLTSVPSAPQNVTWSGIDSTSVQLNWQSPLSPNGVITNYVIYISQDPNLDLRMWKKQLEPGTKFQTQIRGLLTKTTYNIRMLAETSAGEGSLTDAILITANVQNASPTAEDSTHPSDFQDESSRDQHLGVIVGLAIGLGFALVCSMVLLWRSRCIKTLSPDCTGNATSMRTNPCHHGNGSISHVNGIRFHKEALVVKNSAGRSRNNGYERRENGGSLFEMEAFSPMLATIPTGITDHLDTKGGYSTVSQFNHSSATNGSVKKPTGSHYVGDNERNEVPLLRSTATTLQHQEERGLYSSGLNIPESAQATQNVTILSQSTDDTCLSCSLNQGLGRGGTRSHSLSSSVPSLGACSEGHLNHSSRSLEDNITGICSVDQSVARWKVKDRSVAEVGHFETGPVVSFTGSLPASATRESEELVM